jgi:hypothetical protein
MALFAAMATMGAGVAQSDEATPAATNRLAVADAARQKTSGSMALSYTMPFDGHATLVIEDEQGRRVRNLISAAPRGKGEQTDYWDGKGEDGKPVGAGTYRWHGLLHKGIEPTYEFTFGNPGAPPWETEDGRGGWLSDNSPPCAVAATAEWIILAAEQAEAGSSIIGLDYSGRKQWGDRFCSFVRFVAADDRYVYALLRQNDAPPTLGRLDIKTGKPVPFPTPLVFQKGENPIVIRDITVGGMAVGGNLLAIALRRNRPVAGAAAAAADDIAKAFELSEKPPDDLLGAGLGQPAGVEGDAVRFCDKTTGAFLYETAVPGAGCIAADGAGVFYVCSDDRILKIAEGKISPFASGTPRTASGIALDDKGRVFVADRTANQVMVYDGFGKLEQTIGAPGGRLAGGAWQANGMLNPAGIAVDSRGRLWVAEEDACPKRISVWSPDGELAQDFIGPAPRNAWDVTADPDGETRVFGSGCEFRLDYQAGKATVVAGGLKDASGQYINVQGREYFAAKNGRLYLRRKNATQLVAAMHWLQWTQAKSFSEYPIAFTVEWEANGEPSGHHGESCGSSFLWTDLNDDGKAQPEETVAGSRQGRSPGWRYPYGLPHGSGGYWLDENFNLYSFGCERGFYYPPGMGPMLIRIPLKGWTPGGAPIWDLQNQQFLTGCIKSSFYQASFTGPEAGFEVSLPNGQKLFSKGNCNWQTEPVFYVAAEGKAVIGPPITGVRDDGVILWSLKEDWPGTLRWYWDLPGKPPISDRDDSPICPMGCIGRAKTPAGTVFAVISDVGRVHLITVDGLIVAGVFQDSRRAEPWPQEVRRGTRLAGVSLDKRMPGGHFFKAGQSNGYYLIAGSTAYNLIRLNGLESLAAIPGGDVIVNAK